LFQGPHLKGERIAIDQDRPIGSVAPLFQRGQSRQKVD
jgi:hypothetical protein